ncbi:hypothetical protein BDZ89DRAFT_1080922 [Hymenopellis radicata]|nr:hypothetical protein BDZ89DRAFT_1080922 [Hymenopellis radicata]
MPQLDALLATFANSMREFTLYGTVNALSWSKALPLSRLRTFTFCLDIEEKAENVLRWMTSQLLTLVDSDGEVCCLNTIIVELQLPFICRYEWEQITASMLEPWSRFIDVVRRIPSARAFQIKLIPTCYRGRYEDVMMRVRALGDDYMQAYLSCIHVDDCPLKITL